MAAVDIFDRVNFDILLDIPTNIKTKWRLEIFVAHLVNALYINHEKLFELLHKYDYVIPHGLIGEFFEDTFPDLLFNVRLSFRKPADNFKRIFTRASNQETKRRLNLFFTHLVSKLCSKYQVFGDFLNQGDVVTRDQVGPLFEQTFGDLHLLLRRATQNPVLVSHTLKDKAAELPNVVVEVPKLDLSDTKGGPKPTTMVRCNDKKTLDGKSKSECSSGNNTLTDANRSSKLLKAKKKRAKNTEFTRKIYVKMTSEAENEETTNDGPTFTTYVAPDAGEALESSSESENEEVIDGGPVISSYVGPDEDEASESSSESENEEVIDNGPAFTTYEAPLFNDGPVVSSYVGPDEDEASESFSESENEEVIDNGPAYTTYEAPLINDGPVVSSYVGPDEDEASESFSDSEYEEVIDDGPAFTTNVAPAMNDGPVISSYVALEDDEASESSSESENEEAFNDGPAFTTNVAQAINDGHTVISGYVASNDDEALKSSPESENKEVIDDGPAFTTYVAPAFNDGPVISSYVGPDDDKASESSSESENDEMIDDGPAFTTYVAPAINDGPVISSYVNPNEDEASESSSESENEEAMNDGPAFTTYNASAMTDGPVISSYVAPNDDEASESSTESENEEAMNDGPAFTTYVAPDMEDDSEIQVKVYDGPTISTYFDQDEHRDSDTNSESKNEANMHIQPSFTTYFSAARKSKEKSSYSESKDLAASVPFISTYVAPPDTTELKSGEVVKHRKRKIYVQRTNKVVRELEAKGLKPKVRTPKFKLYPDGKPKKTANPGKPRARSPEPAEYLYDCHICEKVFTKSSNLWRHIEDIHRRKLYKCAVCGSRLSSKRGWKSHEKVHAFDYVKPQCIYCGQVFPTSGARANHVRRGNCPMMKFH